MLIIPFIHGVRNWNNTTVGSAQACHISGKMSSENVSRMMMEMAFTVFSSISTALYFRPNWRRLNPAVSSYSVVIISRIFRFLTCCEMPYPGSRGLK